MQTATAESLIEILTRLIGEIHPDAVLHQDITLDSALDHDLGLDSLARMELLTRLEKEYGTRLPEKVLLTAETPRDLLRFLSGASHVTVQPSIAQPVEQQNDLGERQDVGFGRAKTLQEVLNLHLQVQPDTEHIIILQGDEEFRISYRMLHVEALKVAARLRQLQIEPGDPVAIMLPTSKDYFYSFIGVLYCGGIPVPLYPPARPTQIEEHVRRHSKIISNAGAPILITLAEVKPVARLLMSQVPELKNIVTIDELYVDSPEQIPLALNENDIAFLQYTSGSTGDPKGVILTHANLLANVRAMGKACRVTAADVFVSWLPLYHDMGLIGAWFGSLCHGCRLVVMSPLTFLARPERWLRAIDRFGGTLSASPNFGYEICATRLDDSTLEGLNLESWRMAFNGAEPVIPETLRQFQLRFQKYGLDPGTLAPVYGLAESSVGLAFPDPGRGAKIDRINRESFSVLAHAVPADQDDSSSALEFVCCGRPLPGHQIRIVDEQDRELPERQEGRLQFKGPSSTSGYYRNAAETRKLFQGEWLESGDMAYMAEGEVYLTSRKKDIIIRGGRNIYPHELEEAVGNLAGIRKGSTAVFASRKQRDSAERLVVLTESRQRKEEKLQELKRRVHSVALDLLGIPADEVVITPPGTVLKTSSGKIRRAACRQLYESGHIGRKKSAVWLQLARMGVASVKPMLQRFLSRLKAVLYAGYCWLILGIIGAGVWCGVMLLPGRANCWKFAAGAVRLLCKIAAIPVSIDGLENIPAGGKYILVSNHMSYLDSIILTGFLPEHVSYVAKAELGANLFLRAALRKLDVFFVERFDAEKGVEDTRKIAAGLHRGKRPLFFAEGTLQRMAGLLPFQMGAFMLASEEKVSVIPVVISGTRNILRGDSWFPRRGRVTISIASPVLPKSLGWQGAIELRDSVRSEMLQRLREPDLAGEFTSLLQMDIQHPQVRPRDGS